MENQQERRNVGEKEGGLPSRNSGQTGPEPKEHRIDINEISPRVKNWIGGLRKTEKGLNLKLNGQGHQRFLRC
ncbi:hypothetical protein CK203_111814 [Vitis vinifera]|uniref:Uncharacterized protein n=1 Tax=Vitis vinifera TaxID=29760 RepID=A0A438FKI3_VITVI|nr:hypothetical protein CK203_111814 [Vitis vinifera]